MDDGNLEEWLHDLHPSTGAKEVTEAHKTLTLIQKLNIAIDIASALDYLHNHCEKPIVHCDLKPSNVLLDSDLTGHVSDFGLSRILSEPTRSFFGFQSSPLELEDQWVMQHPVIFLICFRFYFFLVLAYITYFKIAK